MSDSASASSERCASVRAIAAALGRDDLDERLRVAVARIARPATVVCVVGEYKTGKSSLVNALLGQMVCPVDDDLATSALTLVAYGDSLSARLRRRVDHEVRVEAIAPRLIPDFVTEAGNPDNEKGVERVDISLPNELLGRGLVLVDTPGMGGIGSGAGAATLAFLPWADAVIFTSDATAELSEPELEFLHLARERCPNVLLALTKTDIAPEWRRITDRDATHLAAAGIDLSIVPVASALRWIALQRGDDALAVQSGYPALLDLLDRTVLDPAEELAAARADREVRNVADQLGASVRAELEVLDHPDERARTADRAADAAERLEHLRGPGARWSIVVGDRITDLSNDVTHRFRADLRVLTRELENDIEKLKTADDWEELARQVQTGGAEAVASAFAFVESETAAIEASVIDLLADDLGDLPSLVPGGDPLDVRLLWSEKGLDPGAGLAGRALGTGLTGLRGAQGGIIMFGLAAQFLPAGAAAVLLAAPVALGIGAAFGVIQLVDARKRKITQRRQQARTNMRQFVDDVQFEVTNTLGDLLRSIHRSFRDEFGERVTELQRTYSEAARTAADGLQGGGPRAEERTELLRAKLAELEVVGRAIDARGGS